MAEAKVDQAELDDRLIEAIDNESKPDIDAALAVGADIGAPDQNNKHTPLVHAVMRKSHEIVSYLVEKKADINGLSGDDDGTTPLGMVASIGDAEGLKILLAANATIDWKNKSGTTALMSASSNGHMEIVKALLDQKAVLNAADTNGNTALLVAAEVGGNEIVQVLLEARANIEVKNNDGLDAFALAKNAESKETTRLLEAHVVLLKEEEEKAEIERLAREKRQNEETVKKLVRTKPLVEWTHTEIVLLFRTNEELTSEFVDLASQNPKIKGSLMASPFMPKFFLEEMGCKPSDGNTAQLQVQQLITVQEERAKAAKKRRCTIL